MRYYIRHGAAVLRLAKCALTIRYKTGPCVHRSYDTACKMDEPREASIVLNTAAEYQGNNDGSNVSNIYPTEPLMSKMTQVRRTFASPGNPSNNSTLVTCLQISTAQKPAWLLPTWARGTARGLGRNNQHTEVAPETIPVACDVFFRRLVLHNPPLHLGSCDTI